MDKLKIKIILGSTRENRFSDKPAFWIFEKAKKHEKIEAGLLDLRDYPFPFYSEPISPSRVQNGEYPSPVVREWADKIREADGFIFITPEYNHSIPGVLKNALDVVYAEWGKKPMAVVAYGTIGGARAVEHLRGIAVELQMAPIHNAVHLMLRDFYDENRNIKEGAFESYEERADRMLAGLIEWAQALKPMREHKTI